MIHEQRTTVNGRIVRYLESGVGTPLILLHAFPLNADMWRPQLERPPAGWRLIAPDLRGFGGSTIDSDEIGMDDYAHDVLLLMEDLSLQSAAIAGLSMGGYIALAMFRRAPERLAGLILADTRATADTDDGIRMRRDLLDAIRRDGLGILPDRQIPKLLGETTQRERPE